MRIYVAGPYTVKRETCDGCRYRSIRLAIGNHWCNLIADYPKGSQPLHTCTQPDVGKRDANVRAAVLAGKEIARRGHIPFVSHSMYAGWTEDDGLTYDDILRIDFEWLEQCHAILYLGPSPGADMELKHAQDIELTVYRSVEEIPDAA